LLDKENQVQKCWAGGKAKTYHYRAVGRLKRGGTRLDVRQADDTPIQAKLKKREKKERKNLHRKIGGSTEDRRQSSNISFHDWEKENAEEITFRNRRASKIIKK